MISRNQEVVEATVTVQLSDQEIKTLKARTGERNAEEALKARVIRASPKRSSAALRAALKGSLKEETAGKGQRLRSGREAIQWLESCSFCRASSATIALPESIRNSIARRLSAFFLP